MKQTFTLLKISIILLVASFNVFAQPANDDCSGIVDLGVVPFCETDFFTNLDATESNIGSDNFPICFNGGIPQRDVWFQFTASDTILDYRITVTGTSENGEAPMIMPQITIYRGDCEFNGLANFGFCEQAGINEGQVVMDIFGLDAGLTYFLRINDYSQNATPNWGTFQLCIEKVPPISTIDEGGSAQCTGTLFDSGGPDGNYQASENNAFSICPDSPNECINFTLDYYNIDNSGIFNGGDIINFYDGPDTSSPQIGNPVTGSGLNFGNNNGGVCWSVSASSGCLTVEFISDGTLEFEGFMGTWECSTDACEDDQPLAIETDIDTTDIINVLATAQSQITITNIDCPNGYMGVYDNGDNNELGSEKGLLLTSGSAINVANPASFFTSDGTNSPGDADLDSLSFANGGAESHDACIIELDVFAASNELSFEYIFGSEEYPEFVNSPFNDIFAFLISGPGIVGQPNINGQENIAIVPGTATAVEINTVNNVQNWNYYRDNINGQSIAYDGLTSDFNGVKKTLTAHAIVEPCNTYHLKLAIADRGDGAFDSGVFISEIKGGAPQMAYQNQNGFGYLVENCNTLPDQIQISLTSPQEEDLTYTVTISGSADLGDDYTLTIPATITFVAGQTTLNFPLTVIDDLIFEGDEHIIITLSSDFGCGEVTQAVLDILIKDELDVFIEGGDTLLMCAGDSVQLLATGAQDFFWTPIANLSDPNIANPFATPPTSQYFEVLGSINTCSDSDSVWVEVINPEVQINALSPIEICVGDTVFLEVIDNVNHAGLITTDFFGFIPNPNDPYPIYVPGFGFDNTITTSVSLGGCTVSAFIDVFVDDYTLPSIITDTLICQGYPILLSNSFGGFGNVYSWTPEDLVDFPNALNATGSPIAPTDFELISSSARGFCADTQSVHVDVSDSEVNIVPDSIYICNVQAIQLEASTTNDSITWSPNDGTIDDFTSLSPIVTPLQSMWYVATNTIAECTAKDSVWIQLDSLPNLDIIDLTNEAPYCPGTDVVLISQTYQPSNFPDIEHFWYPDNLFLTPDTNLNMVITTTQALTYYRITENNACSDTSEIYIEVIVPPTITLNEVEPICSGESVQIEATSDSTNVTWEWSPETGLSCADCPNPTASPGSTTTYTVTATTPAGVCPGSNSITVNVNSSPAYQFPSQTEICLGDDIALNLISGFGSIYTWTSTTDASFGTQTIDVPVVSPTTSQTYSLTITNADGSCEIMDEITITLGEELGVNPIDDVLLCEAEPFTATAAGTPDNSSGTWSWVSTLDATVNPVDNIIDFNFGVAADSGLVTVLYSNNCSTAATSFTIVKENTDDCLLVLPNIFSPNSDALNDYFLPQFGGETSKVILLEIFDRWGSLVYSEANPTVGWNGQKDGTDSPADVYVYRITYTDVTGTTFVEAGDITLVR